MLKNLLMSIYDSVVDPSFSFEIIVIDNDSNDGTSDMIKERFPSIKYIQNDKNIGFGAAHNIAFKKALSDCVMVLNPDTFFLQKGVLEKMVKYINERNDVGIIAPRLVRPNKELIYSAFRFPLVHYPLFARTSLGMTRYGKELLKYYRYEEVDHLKPFSIEWAQGSCLVLKKTRLKEDFYFDERFFMYLEDTDLCRRSWARNVRVMYYPDAEIIHYYARGDSDKPFFLALWSRLSRIHILSWYKYFKKWRGVPVIRY